MPFGPSTWWRFSMRVSQMFCKGLAMVLQLKSSPGLWGSVCEANTQWIDASWGGFIDCWTWRILTLKGPKLLQRVFSARFCMCWGTWTTLHLSWSRWKSWMNGLHTSNKYWTQGWQSYTPLSQERCETHWFSIFSWDCSPAMKVYCLDSLNHSLTRWTSIRQQGGIWSERAFSESWKTFIECTSCSPSRKGRVFLLPSSLSFPVSWPTYRLTTMRPRRHTALTKTWPPDLNVMVCSSPAGKFRQGSSTNGKVFWKTLAFRLSKSMASCIHLHVHHPQKTSKTRSRVEINTDTFEFH